MIPQPLGMAKSIDFVRFLMASGCRGCDASLAVAVGWSLHAAQA